jgi:endonuclease YncB( thermonuclease family)
MQPRPFTTVLALGALALMPAAAYASEQPRPEALNQPLSGTVITVFDGDTFAVRDTGGSIWRIRLFGADAPESNQRCTAPGDAANCGRDSGIFLTKQIIGRTISCVPRPQQP